MVIHGPKKHKLNAEAEQDILSKSYMGLVDRKYIAEKYTASSSTIDRLLLKLKLRATKQHLIDITKKYLDGAKTKDLAAEYGITDTTICSYFRRHNVARMPIGKYRFNHRFFENIDTEEKAYFLGFIYADGCVFDNTCKVNLSIKDINVLEKFRTAIAGDMPIHTRQAVCNLSNDGVSREYCMIEMTNDMLRSDLARHGVIPRKSEILTFPTTVPDELIRHFLRGYVDGDGSFGKYRFMDGPPKYRKMTDKYTFSLLSTPEFIEEARRIFKIVSGASGSVSQRKKESPSRVRALSYSGGRCVKLLLHYMYDDCNVYLDRKYQNYLSICK